ncbi:MAG TPA: bifunctional glycosyltransferase family 2 protein/CDP-glycerol:glycerophosphate glycerophosphotransferase [Lachnospiraceae bacterium]|nr:bifunctional glycosyltransferase family 2 protein/CDP-glycerol:glycerophosphate glycerophosphotransferase [Lachnospiraceae bacterium]
MKVSIVIPYMNGPHFLEDCLGSLKEQTFKDFVVILVQDKPNKYLTETENIKVVEDPSEVVDNYKSFFTIRGYQTTTVQGVSAARNIGISQAQGDYIYFLDSDDYLFPDTIEKLVQATMNGSVDISYGTILDTWFSRKMYFESFSEDAKDTQNQSEEARVKAAEGDEPIEETNSFLSGLVEAGSVDDLVAKRRGIIGISALNILIRRDLLLQKNVFFQEEVTFYADLSFMARLLTVAVNCVHVTVARYVKRKHNDPVHYPAISQYRTEDRFDDYIKAYGRTREELDRSSIIKNLIDYKIVNYYVNYFATKLRRSEHAYWRKERFERMQQIVSDMSPDLLASMKGYKKRMVRKLVRGNVNASKRAVSLHLGLGKVKKLRKNRNLIATYLYFHVFLKMKMKDNWVIFESFFGKSYSDSPKYIYEYLSKEFPNQYHCIWVINNKNENIPYNAIKVKRYSIRYAYYLARCKYDVFNVRQPQWFRKRKGNVFLETWHGTPLKRLVFDQEEVTAASPLYKEQFYRQSRIWDYLVSANHFSTEAFTSAFLFDNEIVECGYPRNDILYTPDKNERTVALKKKLGIPLDKKTILYAPTWRDDEYYGKGEYKFALKMDLHRFKEMLGKDYVILLRTHYYIADSLDTTGLEDFAYNLSKYNDISELYLISDLLITDYSSVFFDYANLRRPILFYTYDLEKYRDMLRGFYLNIETDMPGPLLYTEDEVLDAIRNIDKISKEYRERYDIFYKRFCHLDDGNASRRIVERVFGKEQQ